MDYIREIRALVGKRPLLLAGAGALIVDGDRVLLQRRADNGMWGLHGGLMEPGERAEDTVRREVLEETGLTITDPVLFGVYSGPEVHNIYPNGDECYFLDVIYLVRTYEGTLVLQESELSEVRWFDIGALPADINAADRPCLRDFAARWENGTLPGAAERKEKA